jgi:hypothetical protein
MLPRIYHTKPSALHMHRLFASTNHKHHTKGGSRITQTQAFETGMCSLLQSRLAGGYQ